MAGQTSADDTVPSYNSHTHAQSRHTSRNVRSSPSHRARSSILFSREIQSSSIFGKLGEMARKLRKDELKMMSPPCAMARSPREFYSLGVHAPSPETFAGSSPNDKPHSVAKQARWRNKASLGLRRRSRVKKCVCGDVKVPSRRNKVTIKYESHFLTLL